MGHGGHFDPDSHVFRAVRSEEEAEEGKNSNPAPPVPKEGVSHFTSFHVSADAPEVMSRLGQALSKLDAVQSVNASTYKIKTTLDTPTGRINSAIQIYADGHNHIVEIRRRRGNTLKFQQFYNAVCDALADIITIV